MAHTNQYDEPNAILIGDVYTAWQLFYDGRPQGQKQYADFHDNAVTAARAEVERLKSEYKGPPCFLYQDDALWTVRLWN